MPIWQKKRKQQTPPPAFCVQSVQTGQAQNPFAGQLHSGMIDQNANRLFEKIRQAVPGLSARPTTASRDRNARANAHRASRFLHHAYTAASPATLPTQTQNPQERERKARASASTERP